MIDHIMNNLAPGVSRAGISDEEFAQTLTGFIPRQTALRAQIADFLRDSILSGKLKPGEKLVERALAKSLAVGQATVREALQVLEHEGLIFKKAKTATFVTELSSKQVAEIVDIRMELEPKAFVLAHQRMTPAKLASLKELLREIDKGVTQSDYYRVSQNDRAFHQAIWKMAENETLDKILNQLCIPLFAYLMVLLSTSRSDLKKRVQPHTILIDHLQRKDEVALAKAVRDHIWNSWFRFLPSETKG
jgi:DNA-binding GntR family transcriptional regulator